MAIMKIISFVFVVFISCASCKSTEPFTRTLRDGNVIPTLGLGTWFGLSSTGDRVTPEEAGLVNAIEVAIDNGYRLIDTAHIYMDEHLIGEALKKSFDSGKVKREEMFVVTKIWNDKHKREDVEPALRESLRKLKLEYVDLYLIHWPVSYFPNGSLEIVDLAETWKGMEDVKTKGLAKSIGISNFNERQITKLLESAAIKPAALQIEVNPNLTQRKLVKFAQDSGIVVMAYSPFGSMPSSKRNKDSPAPRWDDPILTGIGKKYGKTVAQVVLRYLVQRGLVPIPKSTNKSRLQENINIFDFELTPEDVQNVDNFNLDQRTVNPTDWNEHPEYPF